MPADRSKTHSLLAKLTVLGFVIAILGLPVNHIAAYAALVAAALLIGAGGISVKPQRWTIAVALVVVAIVAQSHLAPPKIEEGHNVFITDFTKPSDALEKQLPADVYRFMASQFDALYPSERRCSPTTSGCWRSQQFPAGVSAFSADGIYDRPKYSRRVSAIDFDDPTWLNLGFTNDNGYNWYSHVSDVQRGHRDPRFWVFWHRWRLTMPWYVVYEFGAEFTGSRLCWRGDVLWEQPNGSFTHMHHATKICRELQASDTGRRIFGVAVRPDSLSMTLDPTTQLRLRQLALPAAKLAIALTVLGLLVGFPSARIRLLAVLVALGGLVIVLSDVSLFGGFRYHDGGDDGLVYEGWAQRMVQALMQGDVWRALRGEEDVFYFTPGMRYLRFFERLVFGSTNLGYLSLLLLMPVLVTALCRYVLSVRWTFALMFLFMLTPIGLVFGSNYFLYVQNASRGYADAAAAIIYIAGIVCLLNVSTDKAERFAGALGGGFLMSIAVQVRPNLAPAVAVLLSGVALMALRNGQYRRLAGWCIGFIPVSLCAIHNWYYGGVLVLFSSNAAHSSVYKATPLDYLRALGELIRADFRGDHVGRVSELMVGWLSGPREWLSAIPLHLAAVAVLLRIGFSAKFDVYLRLIAWATVAGHSTAFFYVSTPRYYLVFWLTTLIVVAAWLRQEGLPLARCWRLAVPPRRGEAG